MPNEKKSETIEKILRLQEQIQERGGEISAQIPSTKTGLKKRTQAQLENWKAQLEKQLGEAGQIRQPVATESQRRLISADQKYLWKVLTIPRDKIVKEENWEELAEDCKEAFSLLQSSDESLTPELLELKKRLKQKESELDNKLTFWRAQADSEEIEYPKIPLEEMKPWEKFSQIGFIKYQIKNKKKEEKMEAQQVQKQSQQQAQQQPEEKSFSELFAPIVDRLDKVVSSIGANTERVGKLVGVVEESTKELKAQQTRSSGSGAQVQPSSQQVTADSPAEVLRQRGIVGTPPIVDSTRRGDGSVYGQEHPWLRTLTILLGIIMILGLIGTVIALIWAASNSAQIGAVEKKVDFAISQSAEAKSLAQSAQASANQALEQNRAQSAQIAALQEQLEQYKRQIDARISSIDSRLVKVEGNYATKEDLVVINNQFLKLGEELDELRAAALTRTEFQSEVRRIETWIGNAVVALIGTWVFDNLVRSRLCVGVCAERYGGTQLQPQPQPQPTTPAPSACSGDLTRTSQGTYLVSLRKEGEQGNPWQAGTIIIQLCPPAGVRIPWLVLVQFDSVHPNQGQKANNESWCWQVDVNRFSCTKVANFKLRNVRTEINGVETWGNVPGGSIP